MAGRLAALGHRGVAASTFHAAALRQLRHFWPRVHGSDPPAILDSKAPILAPLAKGLPGGYRYLAVRDLAAEIEWAKARRIGASAYETRALAEDRDAPLPADLMAGLYRRYETAKARAGRIDFEDMLELTIGLIEGDEAIAAEVRDRYRWFSVDEFQDTNPLQAALLETWLGGREDIAVVGDEDQTIYTFTGATSDYLTGFTRATRPPGWSRSRPTTDRPRRCWRSPTGSSRRAASPRTNELPGGTAAAQAPAGQPSVRSGARGHAVSPRTRPSSRPSRPRSDAWQPPGPRTARWRSSCARTRRCPRSRARSARRGSVPRPGRAVLRTARGAPRRPGRRGPRPQRQR